MNVDIYTMYLSKKAQVITKCKKMLSVRVDLEE